MKKKIRGLMLALAVTITVFAASINVSANPGGGENMALIFSDDFNDNYLEPDNWVSNASPEGTRVEEINQRLEIDIKHIPGEYGGGGITLLQNLTGEGVFEVDLQNGFSYNYLYKWLILWGEEATYDVRLRFSDSGHIDIMMRTPEHPDWMFTTLYPGYDARYWNWLFHLKLIRNSNGTFTGIVADEYGHYFEGTTSLTVPLDIPLKPYLGAWKWKYGYPVMVFFDNFKAYGTPVEAVVDIDPDTLNLKSEGQWITAYIQLPEGYDPEDIDATTILLNETVQPVLDPKYDFVTNSSEYIVDHDGDGILERMVKFDTAEVIPLIRDHLAENGWKFCNATMTVTGELLGGIQFEGSDIIRVIVGDVNGDNAVNIFDLTEVAMAYGSFENDPLYDWYVDLNEDSMIDMRDLAIVTINYGKS